MQTLSENAQSVGISPDDQLLALLAPLTSAIENALPQSFPEPFVSAIEDGLAFVEYHPEAEPLFMMTLCTYMMLPYQPDMAYASALHAGRTVLLQGDHEDTQYALSMFKVGCKMMQSYVAHPLIAAVAKATLTDLEQQHELVLVRSERSSKTFSYLSEQMAHERLSRSSVMRAILMAEEMIKFDISLMDAFAHSMVRVAMNGDQNPLIRVAAMQRLVHYAEAINPATKAVVVAMFDHLAGITDEEKVVPLRPLNEGEFLVRETAACKRTEFLM